MSLKCDICGKIFDKKISLSNHRRWHELPEYQRFQKNTRKKLRIAMIGKKASQETKNKMSQGHKGLMFGKRNPNWKGSNINHRSVHEWIRKHKSRPEFCEICGIKTPEELSNIDHNYHRIIEDYRWLCIECHRNYDNERFNSYKIPWNKGLPKEIQPMFRRHHSEESKLKMSLTKQEIRQSKQNSIFQKDILEVYDN